MICAVSSMDAAARAAAAVRGCGDCERVSCEHNSGEGGRSSWRQGEPDGSEGAVAMSRGGVGSSESAARMAVLAVGVGGRPVAGGRGGVGAISIGRRTGDVAWADAGGRGGVGDKDRACEAEFWLSALGQTPLATSTSSCPPSNSRWSVFEMENLTCRST